MKCERRILASACLTLSLLPTGTLSAQQPDPASERPLLELSLDDAVKRALENNADLMVERYNPEDSAQAVRQVEGAYDPFFFSTIGKRSQTDPARNIFAGAETVDTNTLTYDFGISQNIKTGANLRLDFNNSRSDTNSRFFTINPRYDASLNLNLTQPLLRDLQIDRNRQQLIVAKRNREISDVQFRQSVVNTVAGVKQLYYDLLFSHDNLEAQKKSLALASKLLGENQIKVRVGTMAPLDVVAAESEVAGREEGVITAEAAVGDVEDALKRAIFQASDPEVWRLRIVPKDRPTAEPVEVDVVEATQKALESRTDVVAARKNLENLDTNLRLARNQALPALDLIASYGGVGVGGTQILDEAGNPLNPPIEGGYGDALSSALGRDFPTWTVGVNLSYPILNRQASAVSARARIAWDQAQAGLRRLELQVATDVRSAGRAVETNFKRVSSTRAARTLQERRLDAEEKRFAAGMSTNFLVTQAQRDLALAEVNELRAIADYRKSVVNFERVQEAGGGLVFAVATSGSGVSSSVGSASSGRTQTTSPQQ